MPTTNIAKSFKATLQRDNRALGWVIVHIPFDVRKTWGTARPRVRGEINGFAFRSSLFPIREGGHFLLVNKQMQKGGHAVAGSVAQFRMEPDTEERIIVIPPELKRILAEDRGLRRWFDQLNDSMRRNISRRIMQVKSAETRVRRAEQMAEILLSAMEAERELPPILQVAFARRPLAREGWERMSASHRRGHLLGIFYYRSPEARTRRVEKVIEDALSFAEKLPRRKNQ